MSADQIDGREKHLVFDEPLEPPRQATVERLLGMIPMLDRASVSRFDYD